MRFLTARLLREALKTISLQRQALQLQDEAIDRLEQNCSASELAYQRICRDLIEQFLITLDQPEIHDDIRPRLITSLSFYRDEIAIREEQIR